MSLITIIGAGRMGSALCWPLVDNGHTVRLVGTPLDEDIIANLRQSRFHPFLQRRVPENVYPYDRRQLVEALEGAEIVVNGVSSFGVPWFIETVGPQLRSGVPMIGVTKGLVDTPEGDLLTIPDAIAAGLPTHLRGRVSLNAIGGPCIAQELSARRQTGVVFCGRQADVLDQLRRTFATSYYHVWTSTDLVGVEVCVALKNAYALAVCLVVGEMEQTGPDGPAYMYNPQAAVFAQSCAEMRRLLEITGGGVENVSWLPGAGDLYVTICGGRTARLGKLLGQGMPYQQAKQILAGETLESAEIITRVGRALPKLEKRGLVKPTDFPLLRHLNQIIQHEAPVSLPWDSFFRE